MKGSRTTPKLGDSATCTHAEVQEKETAIGRRFASTEMSVRSMASKRRSRGPTVDNLLLLISLRRLLLMLIWQAALRVRALRISLAGIHLAPAAVLLCAVDLLRLRILPGRLACRAVSDGRELRPSHLVRHHVRLAILTGRTLRVAILAIPGGFLALAFFLCLALVLLFLLLGLPLCSKVS